MLVLSPGQPASKKQGRSELWAAPQPDKGHKNRDVRDWPSAMTKYTHSGFTQKRQMRSSPVYSDCVETGVVLLIAKRFALNLCNLPCTAAGARSPAALPPSSVVNSPSEPFASAPCPILRCRNEPHHSLRPGGSWGCSVPMWGWGAARAQWEERREWSPVASTKEWLTVSSSASKLQFLSCGDSWAYSCGWVAMR